MKIDVILSNAHFGQAPLIDITNQICLVIDVIRATSTITTALGCGADNVIIAPSSDDAFKARSSFPNAILCGEDRGIKIEGFDFDNSPLQLSGLDLSRRSVVLKTTNGTESILKARDAVETLTLSILNLHYTMDYALKASKQKRSDLLFLCSGKWGEVSYDDVYTAGLGIQYMVERYDHLDLSDTALLALNAASNEKEIYKALVKSQSGTYALSLGLEEDIRFCSQMNKYDVTGALEVIAGRERDNPTFLMKPC
jgi:2-phosphosulfolactate phosphatase